MAIDKGLILGWVEVDLCVPYSICMPAKFRVTDVACPKACSVQIGCWLLKEIYRRADQYYLDEWPTPWKELFELSCLGYWFNAPTRDRDPLCEMDPDSGERLALLKWLPA